MSTYVVCVAVMYMSILFSSVDCAQPTNTCTGNYKQCGDNKCCCFGLDAYCSNFGGELNYIPTFTNHINWLWFSNNSLQNISARTFQNLSKVTEFRALHLVQNNIENIAEDAFEKFSVLKTLDLSKNSNMNIQSMWNSFKSLITKHNIAIKLIELGITSLDDDPFRYMSNIKCNTIRLSNNRITYLNYSAFAKLTTLGYLDVSMNSISQVSQPVLLKSLTNLDLYGNELPVFPKLCPDEREMFCFPNLKILDLGKNRINNLSANDWNCLKDLEKLKLTKNSITSIPKNVFSGLAKLNELHVNGMWSLTNINPHGFNSSSLTKLLINDNNLRFYRMFERTKSISIFQSCPNLQVLDVSYNQLTDLNDSQILNMFSKLSNLKKLYAIKTKLRQIPKSFISSFPNLTFIDLDSNFINSLHGAFEGVHYLQTVSIEGNKIQIVEEGTFPERLLQTLKVLNIANNPFECTCKMLWFREWINQNIVKQKNITLDKYRENNNICVDKPEQGNITLHKWPNSYRCRSPINEKNTIFFNYRPTKESCRIHDPLITAYIVIGSFLVVFIIMFIIIYKKQWYIKYTFYKMKIKTRHSKNAEQRPLMGTSELHFDGYVIYDDGDREFVHNDLIHILEEKLGYKLHIWHRNAESGSKVEVTVDSIYKCENVIAIVSKRFMNNSWCQFAMDVAIDRQIELKRENTFLIILEDVELKSLSKYWCVILTRTPTAYWCDDESDIKRNVFEQKCVKELGTPLQNRLIL